MNSRALILGALVLPPVRVSAHDDAHQGMKAGMMGKVSVK